MENLLATRFAHVKVQEQNATLESHVRERTIDLEKALAELQANYRRRPSATLARMIEQLKAELAFRKERSSS